MIKLWICSYYLTDFFLSISDNWYSLHVVSQLSYEHMERHGRSSTEVKEIIYITNTQGTLLLSCPFSRTELVASTWYNEMIQRELYLHTQWEDCSPDANTFDGKMTQCPSWWKQGNGAIKQWTMSCNNSPEKNNPSFKAPDVWIPTKSSACVWQTSVCRHTTATIMLLITLILC